MRPANFFLIFNCQTSEGKLLYLLWFNNQIMNEEEYLYWDSIFRILDKERTNLMNMTAIMRVMYIKEKIGK